MHSKLIDVTAPPKHSDADFSKLAGIAEAAKLLHISEVTVRRYAARRILPHLRLGGRLMFSVHDLNAYLAQQYTTALQLTKKTKPDEG
jgi:excisionase family DNA binding protein